jgi:hypothetical protein
MDACDAPCQDWRSVLRFTDLGISYTLPVLGILLDSFKSELPGSGALCEGNTGRLAPFAIVVVPSRIIGSPRGHAPTNSPFPPTPRSSCRHVRGALPHHTISLHASISSVMFTGLVNDHSIHHSTGFSYPHTLVDRTPRDYRLARARRGRVYPHCVRRSSNP